MARPAVFLDRDGTINREVNYLRSPDELVLLPGVCDALRALSLAGFDLVLVTNQSGVARGLFDEATLGRIHSRLQEMLSAGGVQLTGIEYCPHHPDAEDEVLGQTCECRKPAPGMILRAASKFDLDLARCWMIGDAERDIQAGLAAGVQTILVRTGKGDAEVESMRNAGREPGLVAQDLETAAGLILG